MRSTCLLLFGVLSVLFSCRALQAESVPVFTIDPNTDVVSLDDVPGPGQVQGQFFFAGSTQFGWVFTLLEPVRVTDVGWFDWRQRGLSHDTQVGIWSGSFGFGDPFIEVTIPAGDGVDLIDTWRVTATSFILEPGRYVVAGSTSDESEDIIAQVYTSLFHDERIGDTAPAQRVGFNFAHVLVPGANLGPNLFIEEVPEPSTFVGLSIGIVLLLFRTFRAKGD